MARRTIVLIGVLLCATATGAQPVVKYYHVDGLGSVRAVSDASGQVVERHEYLPFGEEWNPQPAGDSRKFTGKERDAETGLDYFGARYYGAEIGRFTTIDPVYTWRDNLLDPQRWNRYSYVRNNPLRYVDPDGKVIWWVVIPLAVLYVLNNPTNTNVTEGPTTQPILPNSVVTAAVFAAYTAISHIGSPDPGPPEPGSSPANVPYSRDLYGGSQTDSPAGRAARQVGEGQPCPSCGETQISGTPTAPSPQHEPPLVKHYYEGGGREMTPAERRDYARSPEALKGTQCVTCQRREGGQLSQYAKEQKEVLKQKQ